MIGFSNQPYCKETPKETKKAQIVEKHETLPTYSKKLTKKT
jgi:hypothetical protein